MQEVKPEVFFIGSTLLHGGETLRYLEHIGAGQSNFADMLEACRGFMLSDEVIELMGRLCYRSFEPGLNKNVIQIRTDQTEYFENILRSRHGSVLEHVTLNFVFSDVSRVFTHELVRHRAGVALSQESLRFVRLDELRFWLPSVLTENSEAHALCLEVIQYLEEAQLKLAQIFDLDNEKKFSRKKVVTSAMRRIAPIGLATTIGWSANIRTLRWVIEMRTHESAEEEIRLVFHEVGRVCKERYPTLFQDFSEVEVEGSVPKWVPKYSKV